VGDRCAGRMGAAVCLLGLKAMVIKEGLSRKSAGINPEFIYKEGKGGNCWGGGGGVNKGAIMLKMN